MTEPEFRDNKAKLDRDALELGKKEFLTRSRFCGESPKYPST